jgi:hypothetical protein
MTTTTKHDYDITLGLTTITCGACGISFAVPTRWYEQKRADRTDWHCPNGHTRHFTGPTEAVRLRDELAREKHRTEQAQADAKWWQARSAEANQREQITHRRLSAHKGVVTKLRKRVALGSCPCCHRKFKDLRDHMRAEHPDWNPEKGAEAIAAKAK